MIRNRSSVERASLSSLVTTSTTDGIKRPRNEAGNVDDGHLPWP
jgi:hypothetical protein